MQRQWPADGSILCLTSGQFQTLWLPWLLGWPRILVVSTFCDYDNILNIFDYQAEGVFGDPEDCAIFIRCVHSRPIRYIEAKWLISAYQCLLYMLFHPAILDGRTGSKLGEHGEHGEYVEHRIDEKHQPDDIKHYICVKETPYLSTGWLKPLYFTSFMATVEKIITYALGEHRWEIMRFKEKPSHTW